MINGHGKVLPKKQVSVTLDGKEEIYQADHIILATGARSRELPALPQDGRK